jgi:hypothetical protein
VIRFDEAKELANLLADTWPTLADSDESRGHLIKFFQQRSEPYQVILRSLDKMLDNWKFKRPPTQRELVKAVEVEAAIERTRGPLVAFSDRVQELRRGVGDAFLAMFAKPAAFVCLDCAEDYTSRGIPDSNPYLLHAHYSIQEVNARPELEVAISDAKRAVPHPLESAALPRSGERTAVLARRVRESIQNLAQRTETARHDARVENPSQTTSETYRSPQVTV